VPVAPVIGEAVVDLGAIATNTEILARAAGSAGLMAVVKANGFGHGAPQVARTALENGASWVGVTSSAEALALRAAGISAPMLMWLYVPGEDLGPVIEAGVDVSAGSLADLAALAAITDRGGPVAQVHLKVDTGLSRGGAPPGEWTQLLTWARKYEVSGNLRVRGVWSHLGNAENREDPRLAAQLRTFDWAVRSARSAGLDPQLCHLANSAAVLQVPEARFDLCRVGIALYGVEPIPGQTFGLRPALTLQASVILTKRVSAGTEVSYGHDWRAERDTTLALVPLGFADGVPRGAGPRASMWINGARRPIAGRISMDQCVLDMGDQSVAAGDRAVIFGTGQAGEPTVADWARWADTNPHEILTGISHRVPRRFLPAAATEPSESTEPSEFTGEEER
jgi:alanine racemase